MSLFSLENVHKEFGTKKILQGVTFHVTPGQRVGFVGVNGSGKSTVLRIAAGLETVDHGAVVWSSGTRMVYLAQDPSPTPGLSVLENIFLGLGPTYKPAYEFFVLDAQLKDDPQNTALLNQMAQVSQNMDAIGGWALENRARAILTELGIDKPLAIVDGLSGGYRKRIALAGALLQDPDVLLLDEPTNHLDALSIEWLEQVLTNFRGALLLVTHDRYFLDAITNRLVEIDRGQWRVYNTNYSGFLEQKALDQQAEAIAQQKFKNLLNRELEWLKKSPRARGTQQKARAKAAEALKSVTFLEQPKALALASQSRTIGKKVFELKNVSKHFGEKTIIKNFSHIFQAKSRVGVIGANGLGKSTLLNLLAQLDDTSSGVVERGETVVLGYFDQHSQPLLGRAGPQTRVIDALKEVGERFPMPDGTVLSSSQLLERFLFFGSQQYTPVHNLSGGEKRRLFLLQLLMRAPNVLLLDEPTNDLDVQTLTVLEDFLDQFQGCVIAVSHDRYFLDRVAKEILFFKGQGDIDHFWGNYTHNLPQIQGAMVSLKQDKTPQNPEKSIPATDKNTLSPSRLKKKREKLEEAIALFEDEKKQLEALVYGGTTVDPASISQSLGRLKELEGLIDEKTSQWLELDEL